VWRIRYALAHKGVPFESVSIGFTEIPKVLGGRFKTVPVIEHGSTILAESWDIADYLEGAFPGLPPIFSGPAEYAMVRLTDAWFSAQILPKMFRLYVLDVHNAARPEDRPYFRQSREAYLKGTSLEEFTAERAAILPALREALTPLRSQLSRYPFLGGSTPNYADYIALSLFQWAASVSTLPLLAHNDAALRRWFDTGLNLFGGIGLDPRMKPLFE
jgi:glutathione S-transferase